VYILIVFIIAFLIVSFVFFEAHATLIPCVSSSRSLYFGIFSQDERSQIQNRSRAMKYLQARYVYSHLFLALFSVEMITGTFYNRVYELERRKVDAQRSELRSQSNGTGDRTDKIRTYNFPQVCSTALHPWLMLCCLSYLFVSLYVSSGSRDGSPYRTDHQQRRRHHVWRAFVNVDGCIEHQRRKRKAYSFYGKYLTPLFETLIKLYLR